MSDVFISYSRKDIAYARLLQNSLRESGVETWIDWDRIPIGEKWWSEITAAIESANVFLFIISGNSVNSDICGKEIQLALQNHKRVIPIIIDEIAPEAVRKLAPELPDINWVVFQRDHLFHLEKLRDDEAVAVPKLPEFDEALRRLSEAIHTDWEWVKVHTELQLNALRWRDANSDNAYLLRGKALEGAERSVITATGKQPTVSSIQVEYVARSREFENAEQQKQLALEKRARQRQRVALWAIAIGLVSALILGFFAWGQRNQYLDETIVRATAQAVAEEQRGIAEEQSQIALEQKGIAEQERQTAIQERDQAVARRLAAEGKTLAGQRYELALLMGVEAVQRSEPESWAVRDLFQIIQTSPRLLAFARGHTADVYGVSAHPNKPLVATASNDGSVILWDVADPTSPIQLGEPLRVSQEALRSVAISPTDELLAAGTFGGRVELYDIQDPEHPKSLGATGIPQGDTINALAFSPDGGILASGAEDGTIALWNTSDATKVTRIGEPLKWPMGGVLSLQFSPDGNLLAPTCFNKFITAIFFWDLSNLEAPTLIPNAATIQTDSIAFHPTLPRVAVGSMDGVISQWDISDPKNPWMINSIKIETFTQILSAQYSADGNTLVTATSERLLTLYDVTDPAKIFRLPTDLIGHTEQITDLTLSPDGAWAYSVSWDDNLLIWDIKDQRVPIRNGISLDLSNTNSVIAPHPTNPWIASGTTDQSVQIWDYSDVAHPKALSETPLTIGKAVDIVFSDAGNLLAVAETGRQIEVFEVDRDGSLRLFAPPLMGHSTSIERIIFSPNGNFLISSDFGYDTYIWQIQDGKIRPVGRPISGIRAVFSADSLTLAVAGDNTLELWDLSQASNPQKLGGYEHTERIVIFGLVMHPDVPFVYGGGADGIIHIFDVSDPIQPKLILPSVSAENNYIFDMKLSPDGGQLIVASGDNRISFWDITEPTSPTFFGAYSGLGGSVTQVHTLGTGEILSTGDSTPPTVWGFYPTTWTQLGCQLSGRNFTTEEWQTILGDEEPYKKTCP